jgi:hypothetical protein
VSTHLGGSHDYFLPTIYHWTHTQANGELAHGAHDLKSTSWMSLHLIGKKIYSFLSTKIVKQMSLSTEIVKILVNNYIFYIILVKKDKILKTWFFTICFTYVTKVRRLHMEPIGVGVMENIWQMGPFKVGVHKRNESLGENTLWYKQQTITIWLFWIHVELWYTMVNVWKAFCN